MGERIVVVQEQSSAEHIIFSWALCSLLGIKKHHDECNRHNLCPPGNHNLLKNQV